MTKTKWNIRLKYIREEGHNQGGGGNHTRKEHKRKKDTDAQRTFLSK